MKKFFILSLVLSGFVFLNNPSAIAQNYNNGRNISYQQFYDGLSPYGNWIDYPEYGYVWVPDIHGFEPYRTNGNWAYTNLGWTWVSDYNWGWAPFHYGRWLRDPFYGWVWVPGYEWAPAWVQWRSGGDYYGWAPMAPGLHINISFGSWNFIPRRYITSRHLNRYYVNNSRNVTIINNTTIINNYYDNNYNNNRNYNNGNGRDNNRGARRAYNMGPSVSDVQTATKMPVRQFKIEDANNPSAPRINNDRIMLYKPTVDQKEVAATARPKKIIELSDAQKRTIRSEHSGEQAGATRSFQNNVNDGNVRRLNERSGTAAPVVADEKSVQRNEPNQGSLAPALRNQTSGADVRENSTPANRLPARRFSAPGANRNEDMTPTVKPAETNNERSTPPSASVESPVRRTVPATPPSRPQMPARTPEVQRERVTDQRQAPVRNERRTFPSAREEAPVRRTAPSTAAPQSRPQMPARTPDVQRPGVTEQRQAPRQNERQMPVRTFDKRKQG